MNSVSTKPRKIRLNISKAYSKMKRQSRKFRQRKMAGRNKLEA